MSYIITAGYGGPLVVTSGYGTAFQPLPPPVVPVVPGQPLQTLSLPMYLYEQYRDDSDLQAFVRAFNTLAQNYLDWFNDTPLGLYTSPNVSGPLLDWIMQGIYGLARPVFSSGTTRFVAGMAAAPMGGLPMAGHRFYQSGTATIATDDYFKRLGTWWLYAGTTRRFTVQWLRMRVARFLYGVNGADVSIDAGESVHIQPSTLTTPPAPTLAYVPGGTFGARIYAVRNTYVSSVGESLAGQAATITVPANNLLVVASPAPQNGAIGYNPYVALMSTNPGHFRAGMASAPMASEPLAGSNHRPSTPMTKQNLTPLMIGQNWGEPASGLIVGASLPTVDESNDPGNFIITVPASEAATYLQQAFQQDLLAFPFLYSATVVVGA